MQMRRVAATKVKTLSSGLHKKRELPMNSAAPSSKTMKKSISIDFVTCGKEGVVHERSNCHRPYPTGNRSYE